MATRNVGDPIRVSGRIGELHAPVPQWFPNLLRRFWDRTKKFAKSFSKQMLKDREEELLKVVAKDFEQKGRNS